MNGYGFLVPSTSASLRKILATLATQQKWLHREAQERSFLVSYFALQGLALSEPVEFVFSPMECLRLMGKAMEPEDDVAAIEFLRQRVIELGKLR